MIHLVLQHGGEEAVNVLLMLLAIEGLLARVRSGAVTEVVLAMNATMEGQTTMHYLAERLEGAGVTVSTLAHGVPVGGELDYLDEGTIAQALRARRPLS